MQDFARDIEQFFAANDSVITKLHPGLNIHELLRELTWFSELKNYKLNLADIFEQLLEGKPLAYIIGYRYFFDSFFKVNESTLIPRAETEILVQAAIDKMKGRSDVRFADIGCGSGIIGLTVLKHLPKAHVYLSDICLPALEIAKENYFNHAYHYSKNQTATLVQSDRLENLPKNLDMIVSNPPYIKEKNDKDQVHQQVLEFEPHQALFLADSEYEQWFIDFFNQVAQHLAPKGVFLMEGHELHLDELSKVMGMLNQFENISVLPDLSGRARFIVSTKNG